MRDEFDDIYEDGENEEEDYHLNSKGGMFCPNVRLNLYLQQ